MKITVRCFASVRELLGAERLEVEVPAGTTVEGLKLILGEQAPKLSALRVACAVNRDYVAPQQVLCEGDEVALIPPISGGSPPERCRFDLVHGELDARPLEREVRSDADGAVVTFAGVTRDHNDGDRVLGLAYECYEEMAHKCMVSLFERCFARFEISRARVLHRLGEVPIGEASVIIVVAAAHRGPAFDACRYLMDEIKAEVPIFKQEQLADGGELRWIGQLPEDRPATQ